MRNTHMHFWATERNCPLERNPDRNGREPPNGMERNGTTERNRTEPPNGIPTERNCKKGPCGKVAEKSIICLGDDDQRDDEDGGERDDEDGGEHDDDDDAARDDNDDNDDERR